MLTELLLVGEVDKNDRTQRKGVEQKKGYFKDVDVGKMAPDFD